MRGFGTLAFALRPTHCVNLTIPGYNILRGAIACAAMFAAVAAGAAETTFSSGLSPQEMSASGITRLTPDQVLKLNGLVKRDVVLARQGGVTGFSSNFTARLTAKERVAAGTDRLSESELSNLDALAARAIALPPPPSDSFTYEPPAAAAAPPGMEDVQVTAPLKLQVHGDLSVTVGGGSHGSSFFGTSEDLFVTDPSGKFTLGVGFSEFKEKGFFGPCGPCNPAFYGPPFGDW
jgi:hypothetical protein